MKRNNFVAVGRIRKRSEKSAEKICHDQTHPEKVGKSRENPEKSGNDRNVKRNNCETGVRKKSGKSGKSGNGKNTEGIDWRRPKRKKSESPEMTGT